MINVQLHLKKKILPIRAEYKMKKLILLFITFLTMNSYAGDMSMYCGQGFIEEMDEFVASGLISGYEGKAIANFSKGLMDYTVIYDHGQYTFYISNQNQFGFDVKSMKASGPFYQSDLVDGFSCHLND